MPGFVPRPTYENADQGHAAGVSQLVDALAVNVYDVMSHATVVLSQDALSRVVETLK